MSETRIYQGREVDVVEVNGGWTTVLDENKPKKVRNSELSLPEGVAVETGPDDRLVKADLNKYEVSAEVRTACGRRAVDSGDEIAAELRGMAIEDVYHEAADRLGTTVADLQEKYGHLNIGMQRMNLGNRIRGAIRRRNQKAADASPAE